MGSGGSECWNAAMGRMERIQRDRLDKNGGFGKEING
jgi:hypothetical protein